MAKRPGTPDFAPSSETPGGYVWQAGNVGWGPCSPQTHKSHVSHIACRAEGLAKPDPIGGCRFSVAVHKTSLDFPSHLARIYVDKIESLAQLPSSFGPRAIKASCQH
jgi:hypothetical protein